MKEIQTAEEFLQGPDEVDWLVEGLIPRGSLCLVAGKPKVGKSLLALNLALAAVCSRPFLGRACQGARAAVIQLEDPAALVRRRLRLMLPFPPQGLFISAGRPWGADLQRELPALIKERSVGLLVIDPLVLWSLGGRVSIAESLRRLRRVVQETGVTVVVVHCLNRGLDFIAGSSGILDAMDVALEMVKIGEGYALLQTVSKIETVSDLALELYPGTLIWHVVDSAMGPKHQ